MEAGEMLNIQNSTPPTSASSSGVGGGSGGTYHLTAASSRGAGGHPSMLFQQQPHIHLHPDLPVTSGASLSRAKSDTSLGMINGGGLYGNTGLSLAAQDPRANLHPHGPPVPPLDNLQLTSLTISDETGIMIHSAAAAAAMEPAHVGYAKALYAYLSNGDNQLSFLEGDYIALIGERNRGWQFGENLRSQKMGWFPVAYTETLDQPLVQPASNNKPGNAMSISKATASPVPPPMPPPLPETAHHHNNNKASVPQRTPENVGNNSGGGPAKGAKSNLMIPSSARTSDSLHSSNDSGFSNDVGNPHHPQAHPGPHGQVAPPPQPEVDYSDEEPQLLNRYVKSSAV